MWLQQHYTIGLQTLLEAGANCENSYTEISKTINLDLTNIPKLHNNKKEEKRYFYSAPFCKLCRCIILFQLFVYINVICRLSLGASMSLLYVCKQTPKIKNNTEWRRSWSKKTALFMLYLLGGTADKGLGVQYSVQLAQNGGEVGVSLDSGQQVIITALLFDNSCCLLGQNADLLMAVLK